MTSAGRSAQSVTAAGGGVLASAVHMAVRSALPMGAQFTDHFTERARVITFPAAGTERKVSGAGGRLSSSIGGSMSACSHASTEPSSLARRASRSATAYGSGRAATAAASTAMSRPSSASIACAASVVRPEPGGPASSISMGSADPPSWRSACTKAAIWATAAGRRTGPCGGSTTWPSDPPGQDAGPSAAAGHSRVGSSVPSARQPVVQANASPLDRTGSASSHRMQRAVLAWRLPGQPEQRHREPRCRVGGLGLVEQVAENPGDPLVCCTG